MENLKSEMQSILRLKELLQGEKDALVGLEYLIYIKDEPNVSFVCSLCSKKGAKSNILLHIKSSIHKSKFLSKHFPSVTDLIHKKVLEDKSEILNNICESVEKRFGRLMPCITSKLEMSTNKDLIIDGIKTTKHFSENLSQTFLQRLKDKIKRAPTKRKINQLEGEKTKGKHSRQDENIQGTSIIEHQKSPKRLNSSFRSPTQKKFKPDRRLSRSPMNTEASPKKLRKRSGSRGHEGNDREAGENSSTSKPKTGSRLPAVVQKYSLECSSELKQITRKYESYKKNPHTHPRQTEEWNAFWLRQFYSLNGNPDPDVYNKWNVFWPKRMAEIHDEDILVMRVKLRRKLDLPIESSDLKAFEEVVKNRKVKLTERKPFFQVDRKWQETAVKVPAKYLIDLEELSSEISKKLSPSIQSAHMSSTVLWPEMPKLSDMGDTSRAEKSVQGQTQESVSSTSILIESNESRASRSDLFSLSNNEIKMLFENFAKLTQECQSDLIAYMHQVEKKDPDLFKELVKMTVSCDSEKVDVEGIQEVRDTQNLRANESDDDDVNLLKTVLENVNSTKQVSTIDISSESSVENEIIDTNRVRTNEKLRSVDHGAVFSEEMADVQQISVANSGEKNSIKFPCAINILDVTIIEKSQIIDSDDCQIEKTTRNCVNVQSGEEHEQQESLKVIASPTENEQFLGIDMPEEMVVEGYEIIDCDPNQHKQAIEKVQEDKENNHEQQEVEDLYEATGSLDLMITAMETADAPSINEVFDQSVIQNDKAVDLGQVENKLTISDCKNIQDGKQDIQDSQELESSLKVIRIDEKLIADAAENPLTGLTIEISDESSIEDDENEKQTFNKKPMSIEIRTQGGVFVDKINQQQAQDDENIPNVIVTDTMLSATEPQSTSVIIELSDESSFEDCEPENPDRHRQSPTTRNSLALATSTSVVEILDETVVEEIIDLTL